MIIIITIIINERKKNRQRIEKLENKKKEFWEFVKKIKKSIKKIRMKLQLTVKITYNSQANMTSNIILPSEYLDILIQQNVSSPFFFKVRTDQERPWLPLSFPFLSSLLKRELG